MIDYRGVRQSTVINLTHHSYFNLAGHDGGNIYGHLLEMDALHTLPPRGDPHRKIIAVKDTPLTLLCAQGHGQGSSQRSDSDAAVWRLRPQLCSAGLGYRVPPSPSRKRPGDDSAHRFTFGFTPPAT